MKSKSAMPEMRARVPLSVHDEMQRRAAAKGVSLSHYHRTVLLVAAKSEDAAALAVMVEDLQEQTQRLLAERDRLQQELAALKRAQVTT